MDPSAAYVIRKAVPDDATGAAACVKAAYEHYVRRNGKFPAPMRDDYRQVIGECDVHVAERDGVIVGVLVLREASEGYLLDNIAVSPGHQGTGLGRRLLELAEHSALEAGHDSIYLYTQEIMVENRALYERIGYEEYARRHELGLDRIYMRKRLTSDA
jgi:GNAT superfamily N-acetyltransferase